MAFNGFTLLALGAMVGGTAYSLVRRAYFSLQIALVTILVFALEVVTEGDPAFLRLGAVTLQLGFTHGPDWAPYQPFQPWEPFTLVTALYVHAGLLHLLYNMLALVFIGLMLEDRIGHIRFALAYYTTGILGALGFLLVNYNQTFLLIGASTAVSGIFGVFARLYPREKISLWLFLFPLPPIPVYLLFIGNLLFQFFLAFTGNFLPLGGNVAYVAHIVSSAAGWGLAPLYVKGTRWKKAMGPKVPDPHLLLSLATTVELRNILDHIEKETVPEVRDAWLERFRERARCPKCGGELKWSFGNATSACGWRLKGR